MLEDKPQVTQTSDQQPRSPKATTNPQATTQTRAGALMFPSSCLDGGITRVGPGQYPQCARALYGGEAVSCSSQQHSTAQKMSPNSDMVAEQWLNTVPQSLKSDSSGVAAATSETLVEGRASRVKRSDRVTLMHFPFWRCKRSRNGGESARTVPKVPGEDRGYRHARWGATPGADDSEGAGDSRCTPGAKL